MLVRRRQTGGVGGGLGARDQRGVSGLGNTISLASRVIAGAASWAAVCMVTVRGLRPGGGIRFLSAARVRRARRRAGSARPSAAMPPHVRSRENHSAEALLANGRRLRACSTIDKASLLR
jgi:hypothetical protein